MANSFGGGFSRSIDYKSGPYQNDHQRDLLTEWGKKKIQKITSTYRHPMDQNVLLGETNTSHFKTGFLGEKQRFGVGFDSAGALDFSCLESNFSDSINTQPNFNSFFSDNQYSKSSHLQNDFSQPPMDYYDSSFKHNDAETDKPANIVAVLNKILEDTDELMCNSESESIGQLAIKLADLNLFGSEPVQSVKQQSSSLHNGGKFYDNPAGPVQSYCKEPIVKIIAKNNSPPTHSNASTSVLLKNEKPAIPKRKNDYIIKDMKKKKYIPWNWYQTTQNQNNIKDPRKTSFYGYGMKPVQKQGPAMAHQAAHPGQRNKNPPSKYSGPPFWMQFMSNDSKSDGSSSSSNSSVYKDHTSRTSTDESLKNYKQVSKSNDSGKAPFFPRQPRRFRKTYSSESSSTGGMKTAECVFCKTNGETSAIYRGHVLKDDQGRTVCPVLQQYVCTLCGATGFNAHTFKYCPKNENPPPIATMTTLKSMRSSTGRKRHGPCAGHIRPIPFGFNNRTVLEL